MNLFFTEQRVTTVQERKDMETVAAFHLAAMNNGLFLAPRGLIALSTVMTEAIVDQVVERAAAAMREVRKALG